VRASSLNLAQASTSEPRLRMSAVSCSALARNSCWKRLLQQRKSRGRTPWHPRDTRDGTVASLVAFETLANPPPPAKATGPSFQWEPSLPVKTSLGLEKPGPSLATDMAMERHALGVPSSGSQPGKRGVGPGGDGVRTAGPSGWSRSAPGPGRPAWARSTTPSTSVGCQGSAGGGPATPSGTPAPPHAAQPGAVGAVRGPTSKFSSSSMKPYFARRSTVAVTSPNFPDRSAILAAGWREVTGAWATAVGTRWPWAPKPEREKTVLFCFVSSVPGLRGHPAGGSDRESRQLRPPLKKGLGGSLAFRTFWDLPDGKDVRPQRGNAAGGVDKKCGKKCESLHPPLRNLNRGLKALGSNLGQLQSEI
jgi:hypothetical protein